MQSSSKSPYEGKLCRIMIKSKIVYHEKWEETYVEAKIAKWAREGVYLDDGNFLPWSNIGSIAPLEPLDSPEAGTQAVELTADEIWYLWTLANDDRGSILDENVKETAQSARKKLLRFVHPNCAEE